VEGFTTPEIRDTELSPAVAAQPAVVTVWAGVNDIRVSLESLQTTAALKAGFQDAYTTILLRLRQETSAYIVTANVPDVSRMPFAILLPDSLRQLAHDDSLAVNEAIAQVAATYNVQVVDVYSDPDSYAAANFYVDGFHPNDAGYLLLAGKFESVLKANAWQIVSGHADVNGDGVVNAADAGALLSIVGGLSSASDRQVVAADLAPAAGDNGLRIEDAISILRLLSGLSR
jgi:lysophospholipase L1-like esterase